MHTDTHDGIDEYDGAYDPLADPHYCPMCDDNRIAFLGALGNLYHWRCTACGWTYATDRE